MYLTALTSHVLSHKPLTTEPLQNLVVFEDERFILSFIKKRNLKYSISIWSEMYALKLNTFSTMYNDIIINMYRIPFVKWTFSWVKINAEGSGHKQEMREINTAFNYEQLMKSYVWLSKRSTVFFFSFCLYLVISFVLDETGTHLNVPSFVSPHMPIYEHLLLEYNKQGRGGVDKWWESKKRWREFAVMVKERAPDTIKNDLHVLVWYCNSVNWISCIRLWDRCDRGEQHWHWTDILISYSIFIRGD